MKKYWLWLLLFFVFLLVSSFIANCVADYAEYRAYAEIYGMIQFCIRLIVMCTGVIVFFVEKNGIQTRKKIEEEFDELHERLCKEKLENEKKDRNLFGFVQQQEDADQ